MWDARQYLKYADERERPFHDLLARIACERTDFIADLGCGPGQNTRTIAERWPNARVIGVDHSAAMLSKALPLSVPVGLEFVLADITAWQPDRPLDLIVSNAALQWVNDHETQLARFIQMLAPGGTLAVQMPYHFHDPAHLAIDEAKADSRWRAALTGVGLHQQSVMPLTWYVERLLDEGLHVDAWQTTYLHVLTGTNPVLEWFKGSALRPLLAALEPRAQEDFLADIGSRFQTAYPARGDVTVLPFPRIFFVATRGNS